MIGVILAAGRGSRMGPLSALAPKPLLPILDRPVLFHQIDTCRALGITDVWIVIGADGQAMVDAVGDGRDLGVRPHFRHQAEPLGIAHALRTVEREIAEPFLLFLGDVFFAPRDLDGMLAMLTADNLDGVLAVTRDPDPAAVRRNYSAFVNDDGLVERVVEKPKEVLSPLKGCGIYLFQPSFFDAVRATPQSGMRNEYELTDSIQIFLDDGARVATANAIAWDVNLTTPADLLSCNQRWLAACELPHFVAESARVSSAARVERSVIGAHAIVTGACVVRDSLVLAHTRVADNLDGVIATPRGEVLP